MEIGRKEVTESLQAVVSKFNTDFNEWMNSCGCRATFGWKYGIDQHVKEMEIQCIDLIVYRKPPPPFKTIQEAVEKAKL
jgi:hypothetical protein